MASRKRTRQTEEEEEESTALTTTDLPEARKSRKRRRTTKKHPKRKRETLYRTKVRRSLLKQYHILIRKRKDLRKKIIANRRHRNQLIFHRT